jgi:cephalosporin-C deacetylase-like acetyl esterase
MLMLTDQSGFLTGEEEIKVLGVNVAVQRETQRARQLEFLQITANPIDAQLVGPKGRAEVLRAVSQTIGLDGEKIVPTDDELNTMQRQQAAMQQQQQAAAQAQGAQAPKGGNATQDMGPRTNIAGGVQ